MGEQQFNINFVRTMRRYPQVYDPNHVDYHLRHVTDAAWADISRQVGEDVKTCKEKWKNLRTVFRRNLLKECGPGRKPYYLNEHMKFMVPLLGYGRRRSQNWYPLTGDAKESEGEGDQYYEEDEETQDEQAGMDDPMLMVETVIKKEQDSPPPRERTDKERPSTTHMSMETHPELRFKGVQIIRCKSTSSPKTSDSDKAKKPKPNSRVPDDKYDSSDEDDDEENLRKKLKTEEPSSSDVKVPLNDPDTQFLLSLKPEMEQMSARQKRKFKKEIFNLLDAILDEQEDGNSVETVNLPSSTSPSLQQH